MSQVESKSFETIIKSSNKSTTNEKIEKTYSDEIIFGICSPIGSLKKEVIQALSDRLKNDYEYEVIHIKLSEYILKHSKIKFIEEVGKTLKYSELNHKIKGGDFLRKEYKSNSLLVEFAIKKIRENREEFDSKSKGTIKNVKEIVGSRKCYIIDSLKNKEEVKLLRSVYREMFYLFSIFSPEKEREDRLIDNGLSKVESKNIITTDEFENILHGQDVRNTFIEGDFFIRISKSNKSEINSKVEKYLHLILNTDIITPNCDETAMYYAKSAAGNSACLSRQVGASITDKNGISISKGWNDVPKFGGNLYQDSDSNPQRCKNLGFCSNVKHRNEILDEISTEIDKFFNKNNSKELKIVGNDKVQKKIILDIIKNSKFKDIIEYSRSIHAEMHAIITGSQLSGDRMIGGNLYCTTYPCHNCARHIILAGIKKVYYIEPYKKSLGIKLHSDSLTENENESSKVQILLYDGVAPRRYLEFFEMNSDLRKNKNGILIKPILKDAKPKKRISLQALPVLEEQAIHTLNEYNLIDYEN